MARLTNCHHEIVREVRNLGWLLRHWDDIAHFEVRPRYGNDRLGGGCYMVATLKYELGRVKHFETEWEDHTVCLDWLARPVFVSVPLTWFGLRTEVPSTKMSLRTTVRMIDPTTIRGHLR